MGRRERKRQKQDGSLPAVQPNDPPGNQISVEREITWQGPLPPPHVLQAFREAVPRSDEVILSEFQKQGEHRRSTETRESQANAFALKTISLGTVLANLATVGGGIYLAILGHIWGAGIVIGGPLVTVILNKAKSKEDWESAFAVVP